VFCWPGGLFLPLIHKDTKIHNDIILNKIDIILSHLTRDNIVFIEKMAYLYHSNKATKKLFVMKKGIFLITLMLISVVLFAQTDSIFMINGKILPVNVTEVTENSIKYTYPNEEVLNTVNRNTVSKVIFKSGRVQEFGSQLNLATIKSCLDWQNVQISKIESEVKGLMKIDNVGAKAKGTTTLSSIAKLQDRAFNKMKMQSAMMGGNIIYLLNEHAEEALNSDGAGGSSRPPSVTVSGVCYTVSKPNIDQVVDGKYNVARIIKLGPNEFNINDISSKQQSLNMSKSMIKDENGFLSLTANINQLKKVTDFTVISAGDGQIVLCGKSISGKSKTYYYNVFLVYQGD